MQRARKLLKACKSLNNTPAAIISHIAGIIAIIITAGCLLSNLYGFMVQDVSRINQLDNISSISMIVVLLCIRSIYTGFFEDKRQGTKNNLRALTIHLPISKKEFIFAQYLGTLYLFMPAFILIIGLIVFNLIGRGSSVYTYLLGTNVLMFSLTYCFISLEKGALIYYYIDPRIREVVYLALTFGWMGINYLLEAGQEIIINQFMMMHQSQLWARALWLLGKGAGLVFLVFTFIGGYLLSVKVPLTIERSKTL